MAPKPSCFVLTCLLSPSKEGMKAIEATEGPQQPVVPSLKIMVAPT
jgi:hypothetical protein